MSGVVKSKKGQPVPVAAGQLLLTAGQVAERLGVSARTVWRLVAAGRLPQPVRYSRKLVRWKAEAVEQYVRGLP